MEFPSIYPVQVDGFQITPIEGREVMRADGGDIMIRDLWAEPRYQIQFNVGPIEPQMISALRQFYQSYKNQEITWRDPSNDNEEYLVYMTQEPRLNGIYAHLRRALVTMEGRRA